MGEETRKKFTDLLYHIWRMQREMGTIADEVVTLIAGVEEEERNARKTGGLVNATSGNGE